jgi:hypothetical protein
MSLNKPIWKLRDWIDKDKLDWSELSKNPNALKMLEENEDKIDWYKLLENPTVIQLIENEINKNNDKSLNPFNKYTLSTNSNAIHLLQKILI